MKQKHEKKEVSNLEYNNAYNNTDNIKITKKVLSFYRPTLDEETLKSCGMRGLWRALQFHQERFKNKFTTSLWRFVNWECENEVKKLIRTQAKPDSKVKSLEFFDAEDDSLAQTDIFNDISSLLDKESFSIIQLRFLENMTLQEIGTKFGYTKEAARQKLHKALLEVKRLVYNSE